MSTPTLTKWIPALNRLRVTQRSKTKNGYRTIFGIKDMIKQEKPVNIFIEPVAREQHVQAIQMLKEYFLKEHVLIREQGVDLNQDHALDEYLHSLLRQGNTIYAKTDDGTPVGICVNITSSLADTEKLRKYASYRQDPVTKDFLNFTAKLQETPNLWEVFKVPKIFEIKMLTVIPEYRRQGLATKLAETSRELAETQGFDVVRMDCINPYEVAERIPFHCMVKYPIYKLRVAPTVPRRSVVRVYVGARNRDHPDADLKRKRVELEKQLE